MSGTDQWPKGIGKLNVYRAKGGPAPHKPILLLVLLELAERQQLSGPLLPLTPELTFQFSTWWRVVAHRRTQSLPAARRPSLDLVAA